MTSKNTSVDGITASPDKTKTALPGQNTGDDKTAIIVEGGGVDGKDLIVISDEKTGPSLVEKVKALFRSKKVLVGLGVMVVVEAAVLYRSSMLSKAQRAGEEEIGQIVPSNETTV